MVCAIYGRVNKKYIDRTVSENISKISKCLGSNSQMDHMGKKKSDLALFFFTLKFKYKTKVNN